MSQTRGSGSPGARSPLAYLSPDSSGFLNSLSVDRPLALYDLAGSIAHVEMLGHCGLLTPAEVRTLLEGLRTIGQEVAGNSFLWRPELEDVHTNVETRLTELVGPLGGKLHTARSRNDQVALDERLYLRFAVRRVAGRLLELERILLARAEGESTTPMPGYTHLQRAQPVTVGHHLLAHFWRFDRDLDRLFATAVRSNVSPLGAGALAGSTLPIDPEFTARRLGFSRPFENSLDAVSDRDSFAELLFDLALLAVHASGLGEELVLFATKEFGFVERTEALGSGSSLMPQKRNPDVAELVRGKAGRAIGDLVALLTTLKGLPLSYDRDLQEDKAPVLDAAATLEAVVESLGAVIQALRFDHPRLAAAVTDPELFATDLAEYLVGRGVPFRQAHETVASLYRSTAGSLGSEALRANLPGSEAETGGLLDPRAAVERRASLGGPSSASVARQITQARAQIELRAASLSSLVQAVEQIEELVNEGPR